VSLFRSQPPQNPHLQTAPHRGCGQARYVTGCEAGVRWGGAGRGGVLAAIPGAAIFSPIDEAASAAAAGIPETSMGARHDPRPLALRGRRAGARTARGRRGPRGRGARARARPEPRGWGLPGRGSGRAARLQERKAAAQSRGPHGAPTPARAWAPLRWGAAPLGSRRHPGKRGWRGELSPPGQVRGPGRRRGETSRRRGAFAMAGVGGRRGATPGALLGNGSGMGGAGRDGIPSGTRWLRVSPEGDGQRSLSLARQGWGLARKGRWTWPEKFLPFPRRLRERVPGAREPGCQQTRPAGTGLARCSPSWTDGSHHVWRGCCHGVHGARTPLGSLFPAALALRLGGAVLLCGRKAGHTAPRLGSITCLRFRV
jgi:hypothetical protein